MMQDVIHERDQADAAVLLQDDNTSVPALSDPSSGKPMQAASIGLPESVRAPDSLPISRTDLFSVWRSTIAGRKGLGASNLLQEPFRRWRGVLYSRCEVRTQPL